MKKYIRKNKKYLLIAIALSLVASAFAVLVQFTKGKLLDYAIAGSWDETFKNSLYLGLFIAMELSFFYLYDISRAKFTVKSMTSLREDYFSTLVKRDYPQFLKKNQGEYLAEYTNQLSIIEDQYFTTIALVGEIVIKIILVSTFLFLLNFKLALITLFLLTSPLYIPKLVEKRLQKSQMDYVEAFERHIVKFTDWLRAFEIIKNFSIEENIKEKFGQSNDFLGDKNYRKRKMTAITRSISAILSYYSHFVILVFAGYLVLRGEFSPGDFFVAVGMIDQLSYPIISVTYFIQDLVSVKPINEGIMDFISEEEGSHNKTIMDLEEYRGIVFENVDFKYGEVELINDLNLSFDKGKSYLIMGESGSGKTTSINLLLNYFKLNSGSIKVNNRSIDEIANLNELFTVMRQDNILFEDSLRNNLTMYREVEDEVLFEVLDQVGLGKYGNTQSLDRIISENGSNLSGGEKRRISLGRSLLRESPVLILDEPLANLDESNKKTIEKLLLSIEDKTLIIISHEFSQENIKLVDEVIKF